MPTTKATVKHEDILKAVQAVQLGLDPLTTDGINKFANDHRYATINNILRALKPLLKKHNLYLIQKLVMVGELTCLHTVVTHLPSGQSIDSMVHLVVDKPGPQALGSCTTYVRRYSLTTIFQIDTVDDDGNTAEGRADQAIASTPIANTPQKVESKPPSAEPPSKKKIKDCYEWIDHKERTIDEMEVAKNAIMELASRCGQMDKGRIPAYFKMRVNRMKDLAKKREAGEVTVETVTEDLGLE